MARVGLNESINSIYPLIYITQAPVSVWEGGAVRGAGGPPGPGHPAGRRHPGLRSQARARGHYLRRPGHTVQVPSAGAGEAGQVGVVEGTRRGEATILRKLMKCFKC